jgi:DNA-binding NtrC family response regulator
MTKCLLIDDDADDQEIFSMAMRDADSSVHCIFASDGVYGLDVLNSDPSFLPRCIFIDMNMPRMNGLQCLTEIKKIKRLNGTPIYMYSTSADPAMTEEAIKIGALDFIIKPSSIADLTLILRRLLSIHSHAL